MKKFTRQKSGNEPTADINIDFGAAAANIARVFEPGDYRLRIESASVMQKNQNVLVVLDLIAAESGDRIDGRPLWVFGPNASVRDHQTRSAAWLPQPWHCPRACVGQQARP
jgi:hypothetical protein